MRVLSLALTHVCGVFVLNRAAMFHRAVVLPLHVAVFARFTIDIKKEKKPICGGFDAWRTRGS